MSLVQLVNSADVLLASLLALIAFAVVGGSVTLNARHHRVANPPAWGLTLFAVLLLATVMTGLRGAVLFGLLLVGLYLAVRRDTRRANRT
ncbi:hypothetical protein [Natrialba sp. SSL1]|uniref:hypothetical protein n=1 Tax=Natrialba sp. SSL1 TaxID=1869245 RepID=UPI0008F92251|nr:hypothetical protein [Natrialba sp. SSL1]OIB56773.1 hypothetical protein BBD46_16355 [Natrialba sp. SSL1]